MRKLSVFNFVTLNGYFKGLDGDISWHKHGEEENEYSAASLKQESILLFGRVTYEMMASYWPTPEAYKSFPEVADGMNKSAKIVFSRTLKKVEWSNTMIISDNIIEEIKKLKQSAGKDMTILGSGTLLTQFADADLIDEYQIMVDPVAIGEGTSLFKGLKRNLNLKLTETRSFGSGVVLLTYSPE